MATRIGVAMIRLTILTSGRMTAGQGKGIRASPAERKEESGTVTACQLVGGAEVIGNRVLRKALNGVLKERRSHEI